MTVSINLNQIDELLNRAVEEVLPTKEELLQKLTSGKPLRIKLGIDPTTPDLHLGHTVVLRKLQGFMDLGHEAILIFGDFTAQVGDPSGRNLKRKQLSKEEIDDNMKTYREQAGMVLDIERASVRYNSEWLEPLGVKGLLDLSARATYSQIVKRRDFMSRLGTEDDLTMLEMLYPLLQAYDSVVTKADVELGGADQKLNLLVGRRIQRKFDIPEQCVLTCPLLIGTDGEKKMSKSADNFIALREEAKSMYTKILSLPDSLITHYAENCTATDLINLKKMMGSNPLEAKKQLAREIVTLYHGPTAAQQAEATFEQVVQNREIPEDIPEVNCKFGDVLTVEDVVLFLKPALSRSEAKRLIEQGGVEVDNVKMTGAKQEITLQEDMVVRIGKRDYYKIKL